MRDWDAFALEDILAGRGGVAAVARSREEWLEHPAGRQLLGQPPVRINRIGNAPPRKRRPLADQLPLHGVRVLDNTHVIAGPIGARLLAQFGADVLHLPRPDRPDPNGMVALTGGGKRNAYCDLRDPAEHQHLLELASSADVFLSSYRKMARYGLDAAHLAHSSPGIVAAEVHGWSPTGPWEDRGGFDQLASAATGFAIEEWTDRPAVPPTYLLNDYLAAYFAAAGIATALTRQATEGGSWRVTVSLAGACMWVQSLGLFDRETVRDIPWHPLHRKPRLVARSSTSFGDLIEPAVPFLIDGRLAPQIGHAAALGTSPLAW